MHINNAEVLTSINDKIKSSAVWHNGDIWEVDDRNIIHDGLCMLKIEELSEAIDILAEIRDYIEEVTGVRF